MKSNRALSPAQLAELWNVSPRTIVRLVNSGRLPGIRLSPRCIRVLPVDAAIYYSQNSRKLSVVSDLTDDTTSD